MISLKSSKNQKFNEIKLVEILFYTFPLWFIIGNLAVSINTLLFIITALFLIQKKRLPFRFNNSCWLLIVCFLYIFLSTTIQYLSPGLLYEWSFIHPGLIKYDPIIKSLLLSRFIILIIVIDVLFFNKILNLKKLFLFSLICTSFVSFDVILQYITGTDIFGYKSFEGNLWNSGPFNDENIAGGYLKNFSFLSFFYIFDTLNKKSLKNSFLIFIIAVHLLATFLTGNKMPLVLLLFGCTLIVLFVKNFRFLMFASLLIFLSFSFILIKNDKSYKETYGRFLNEINVLKLLENKKLEEESSNQKAKIDQSYDIIGGKYSTVSVSRDVIFLRYSGYNQVYRTSLIMWKEQPLIGFGLKSFRIKCWDILEKDTKKFGVRPQNIACGNHSHNYYLQLLSETGIIGTSLLIIFFIILLKNSFYFLRKYSQNLNLEIILLIPIIINIFLEIWPLRSSGSFFTNWNATFFWLNVGILLSANKKMV